jgi:mannobiose 2-epimerase
MKFKKIKTMQILLTNLLVLIILGCNYSIKDENLKLIEELEKSLRYELLDAWYPVCLDTVYGGFLSDFNYKWKPVGHQNKMLVTQTRHVWTTSEAAMFFNEDRYRIIAEHGFRFLKDKMWDKTYGGFYMLRNREGDSASSVYGDNKIAYGNAFAIYALAVYYKMSCDTFALDLARKTFM